jgi:uncharacterized protein (TIGR00266 family)
MTEPISKIWIQKGEALNIQPKQMLAFGGHSISVETGGGKNASLWDILSRSLAGENFFLNTFSSQGEGGWVALEEATPGQVACYELKPGESILLGGGAWVASDQEVHLSTEFVGTKGFWSGLGSFAFKAKNTAEKTKRVFFTAQNGMIREIQLTPEGGPVRVDNAHMVGYTQNLSPRIETIGNLKSFFLSGEGLINTFEGSGSVFVSTSSLKTTPPCQPPSIKKPVV